MGWGEVRGDMYDERDQHRETFCFASLCYVRDHSSTDVQSRHCPSRATTVAVHKSCGGCHANAFVMPEWRPRQSLSSKSVSSKIMLLGKKVAIVSGSAASWWLCLTHGTPSSYRDSTTVDGASAVDSMNQLTGSESLTMGCSSGRDARGLAHAHERHCLARPDCASTCHAG